MSARNANCREAPGPRGTSAARAPIASFISWATGIAFFPPRPAQRGEGRGEGSVRGSTVAFFKMAHGHRGAGSGDNVVDWFDDFLFRPSRGRYAAGGAVLLSEKVNRIRRGDYESRGVPKGVRIFPVIVTYDTLGETDALYRWIERRCAEAGFLQQADVEPLTLGDVEDFERLILYGGPRRLPGGALAH